MKPSERINRAMEQTREFNSSSYLRKPEWQESTNTRISTIRSGIFEVSKILDELFEMIEEIKKPE